MSAVAPMPQRIQWLNRKVINALGFLLTTYHPFCVVNDVCRVINVFITPAY